QIAEKVSVGAMRGRHRNCIATDMKQMVFLWLASLATLGAAAQDIGTDGAPVVARNPDHSAFTAWLGDNNVVQMRWGRTVNDQIDHYVVEHSTDSAHFDVMHEVVAKDGIDVDSAYQDADAFPSNAVNYYRLTTFL